MTILWLFSHLMGFALHKKADQYEELINSCSTMGSVYTYLKICIYFPILMVTANNY